MSDLIDRQAAIDAICSVCGNDCDKSKFLYDAPQDEQIIICPEHYVLTQLPSAQKTGRWIDGMCSECEESTQDFLTNFCPNCGADMRGNKNE